MIKFLSHLLNNFSQALSWLLGSVVVIFFIYMMTTGQNPKVIVDWTLSTLGKLFIIIFLVQLIISIYCLIQVNDNRLENKDDYKILDWDVINLLESKLCYENSSKAYNIKLSEKGNLYLHKSYLI